MSDQPTNHTPQTPPPYIDPLELRWQWKQKSGQLWSPLGELVCVGYSGAGVGKNNPQMQWVVNVGPIPQGKYRVGEPRDTNAHGPYVLPLTPGPANEMHGRAGFLVHGDSQSRPGTASQGCIIIRRRFRQAMWESGCLELEVLAE